MLPYREAIPAANINKVGCISFQKLRDENKVNSSSILFAIIMQDLALHNISVDKIFSSLFSDKNVEISVLRLDKIHPVISGNKWFKLRYYLEEAKQQKKKTIVTFGGAWSNHIVATAAASKLAGFSSVGIIRGEEATALSPTLLQARESGMSLSFISREEYKKKIVPAELQTDEH
ncbi:MAG: hypothetical protein ACHQEB_07095, partial [Chitinophagales bacterium]